MQKSIIVAMGKNRVIASSSCANKYGLLWHLPEDLKLFKKNTINKSIVMGRKTFESIGSKPLPKRENIIMTSRRDFKAPGCLVAHSISDAFLKCSTKDEIMVCGGAQIYQASLGLVDRLYISEVEGEWSGDIYFPQVDWNEWVLKSEEKMQGFVFKIWERKLSITSK
jgi:dihydrofolate reductase